MKDSNRDRTAHELPTDGRAGSDDSRMSYTIEVQGEPEYLCATTRGRASGEGFARMSRDLWAHPAWLRGMNLLLDHRPLDSTQLTSLEIRQISRVRPDPPDPRPSRRIATVVETDLGFGLTRMWDFFADGDGNREHRIFRTFEEAQRWLQESPHVKTAEDGPGR